ncbi:MAG: class I SAM-dependent methyltransferase [Crocinitomicaceae bacterium]|nr:class I SAM-dependent methyltransferase [Crocinitomicaceae bacterium]
MEFLSEEILHYSETHTSEEPSYLKELSRETWQKVVMPRMLSGHLQGRLLSMISRMLCPEFILEIGTYTGYSALCLAEGLKEGGKLVSIDINDELSWIHQKYISASPFQSAIEYVYGNAIDIIPSIERIPDLVFIDADKENYLNYYEMLIPRMKSGAFILIDNVLWSGKVLNTDPSSDLETIAIQALNKRVQADARVENLLLPVRDGIMILRII